MGKLPMNPRQNPAWNDPKDLQLRTLAAIPSALSALVRYVLTACPIEAVPYHLLLGHMSGDQILATFLHHSSTL